MSFKGKAAVAIGLALFLVISFAAESFAQPTDIAGHWAEKEIKACFDKGWVSGDVETGYFRPDDSITRVEFFKMVNNMFGFTSTTEITFTDVPEEWKSPSSEKYWKYEACARAMAVGYANGDGAHATIRPDGFISREEAFVIIARILASKLVPGSELNFKDEDSISNWAKKAIKDLLKNGMIEGYPDQTIQPQNQITRAEAIVLLVKALDFWNSNPSPSPSPTTTTIKGKVVDADYQPIKKAKVTFEIGDKIFSCVTEGRGNYSLIVLPNQEYDVKVYLSDGSGGYSETPAYNRKYKIEGPGDYIYNIRIGGDGDGDGDVGGGSDSQHAWIISSSLTVRGYAYYATVDRIGLNGIIDLTDYRVNASDPPQPSLDPLDQATAGTIEVGGAPVKFTLFYDPVTSKSDEFNVKRGLSITQDLNLGVNNLDIINYLNALDPKHDGVTLKTLKTLFNDGTSYATLSGLIEEAGGYTQSVSVKVKMP